MLLLACLALITSQPSLLLTGLSSFNPRFLRSSECSYHSQLDLGRMYTGWHFAKARLESDTGEENMSEALCEGVRNFLPSVIT